MAIENVLSSQEGKTARMTFDYLIIMGPLSCNTFPVQTPRLTAMANPLLVPRCTLTRTVVIPFVLLLILFTLLFSYYPPFKATLSTFVHTRLIRHIPLLSFTSFGCLMQTSYWNRWHLSTRTCHSAILGPSFCFIRGILTTRLYRSTSWRALARKLEDRQIIWNWILVTGWDS